MHLLFQKFIDRLSTASSADALRNAMSQAVNGLDLSSFAYLSVPGERAGPPELISDYPSDWTDQYLQNHYERFDPVISRALNHAKPFQWGPGIDLASSSKSKELFNEAAKFGIRYGFTIPIHSEIGPIAAVTFATDDGLPQFERTIHEHGSVLQLMAMYFHAHVRRRMVWDCSVSGGPLSPREAECLEWAAQGKSAWETGRILGISHHTVATYLENAKTKLGVRTIVQAVVCVKSSKLKGATPPLTSLNYRR